MKPQLTVRPGGYLLDWGAPPISIECRRVKSHRDGRLTAFIKVKVLGEVSPGHLHGADFNLVSTAARTTLSKVLTERYEADWYAILEQLCDMVREAHERGEPVQEIWSHEDPGPLKYLVYPLLPLGHPAIIFGDGGSLKSTTGQLVALVAERAWENNPLGLVPPPAGTPTLYLDWEADEDEFRWRLHAIGVGMKLPDTPLLYRRMALPLADDMEAVSAFSADYSIRFLVLDSLGAAAGGDLNATEPCLRLFTALRQLHITSLILAHNSKDQLTKRRTVYGNVHYMNYARSVWEARKSQEEKSPTASLALFHRKWNRQHFPPLGLEFTFTDNTVNAKRQDVREVPDFLPHLSGSIRILAFLHEQDQPEKTETIAKALELDPETVARECRRLKDKGKLVKLDNAWALASERIPNE